MDKLVWHILRVSPGKEKEVQNALASAETYVPVRQTRRFNRRYRVYTYRDEALYPGYVFVKTDLVQRLFSVPCSPLLGVVRSMDREYAVLSEETIALVKQIEQDIAKAALEPTHASSREWAIGAQVKMRISPLLTAIVVGFRGKTGVMIDMNIFGARRTLRVEASQIEAIAA